MGAARVQVVNQQLGTWCERHMDVLMITAPLPLTPGDDAPLLDPLRDRNAAAGMFVNETARGWFGSRIMVQPCRS